MSRLTDRPIPPRPAPLELIAAGHPCPGCDAVWENAVDLDPPGDGDENEGGLIMQHAEDCPLLVAIRQASTATADEVFAEGGEWL